MVTRIIWANDGTLSADRALPVIKDLIASTGASLTVPYVHRDWHLGHRPVLVEACDGSDHYQGVVVAGERDEGGRWLLDDAFTLLTLDHDDGPEAALVVCHGWNCHADRI